MSFLLLLNVVTIFFVHVFHCLVYVWENPSSLGIDMWLLCLLLTIFMVIFGKICL